VVSEECARKKRRERGMRTEKRNEEEEGTNSDHVVESSDVGRILISILIEEVRDVVLVPPNLS